MAWTSRDDSGRKNEYGKKKCPRCGNWVTKNAWGFNSHLKACLSKNVIFEGKLYPAVKPKRPKI